MADRQELETTRELTDLNARVRTLEREIRDLKVRTDKGFEGLSADIKPLREAVLKGVGGWKMLVTVGSVFVAVAGIVGTVTAKLIDWLSALPK